MVTDLCIIFFCHSSKFEQFDVNLTSEKVASEMNLLVISFLCLHGYRFYALYSFRIATAYVLTSCIITHRSVVPQICGHGMYLIYVYKPLKMYLFLLCLAACRL